MLNESITILAINPGTKYIGFAVFQASDLVFWGIKVLKGKWCERKIRIAEEALIKTINYYGVNMLVLKRLHSSRSSKNLNSLVRSIEGLAKKKGIPLRLYSLGDLKEFWAEGVKANKMTIAGFVTGRYPFLVQVLEKEKKHKHPYFIRMFEAIAAGIFAFNQTDHR